MEVLLYSGTRRLPATARQFSLDEATAQLVDYAGRHPTAFRKLSKFMIGEELTDSRKDCRRLAEVVPVVALIAHTGPKQQ